jgi:biotin operon repressor
MTTAERVLAALLAADKALNDDELASILGIRRQVVNQVCRQLQAMGRIARRGGAGAKLCNELIRDPMPEAIQTLAPQPTAPGRQMISEDQVKAAVQDHLEGLGYRVHVMWGRDRGIDIVATGPAERFVLEAKGEVARPPQQVNYFLGALGELVQRMEDPNARYGLALPDNRQYRGLVSRLPAFAKSQLDFVVFFVARQGDGFVIDQL